MAKVLAAVEVKKVEVVEKTGTSTKGRPYTIREQLVWVDLGKDYPELMRVRLEQGDPAYQPGRYVISDEALYLDKYQQLSVGRIKLRPAVAAAKVG